MDDLDWLGIELMLAADDPPKLEPYDPLAFANCRCGVVIIDARWVDDDDQRNDESIAVWRPVDGAPRDGVM